MTDNHTPLNTLKSHDSTTRVEQRVERVEQGPIEIGSRIRHSPTIRNDLREPTTQPRATGVVAPLEGDDHWIQTYASIVSAIMERMRERRRGSGPAA